MPLAGVRDEPVVKVRPSMVILENRRVGDV